MDYAVIQSGGKQYIASVGKVITVDKLDIKEGEILNFDKVLLVRKDGSLSIGDPIVAGVLVTGKILRQYKGEKIDVMKFKAKVRYRKKIGFRAQQTDIQIEKIAFAEKSTKTKKSVKKSQS